MPYRNKIKVLFLVTAMAGVMLFLLSFTQSKPVTQRAYFNNDANFTASNSQLYTAQHTDLQSAHQQNKMSFQVREPKHEVKQINYSSGDVTEVTLGSFGSGIQKTYEIAITPDFTAYGFVWGKGSFSYSWDNSNFVPVSVDHDLKDSDVGKQASDLYFDTKGKDKIYIRTAYVSDLKISLINADPTDTGFGISAGTPVYRGAVFTRLPIVSRAQWGADESKALWLPLYGPIERIIVHHTAGSNTATDWAAVVRSIYYFHAVTRDWADIGYNYLIDPNGVIYEGRQGGEGATAAHTYLHNYGSIGISMIGTYTDGVPSAVAIESLKKLIAEKSALHQVDIVWGSSYYGHRDWESTSCPGTALYAALPYYVNDINNYKATLYSDIPAKLAATDAAFDLFNRTTPIHADLVVTFDVPFNTPEAEVRAMVPMFSSIDSVAVFGNQAYLKLRYYSNNGAVWQFRSKLLYTIFSLDPRIKNIQIVHNYFTFDNTTP